jgi:adenine-specific DNA-methyltransferase
VVNFKENVFDDALTTASIILCANDDKTDKVRFTNIQSIKDLDIIDKLLVNYPEISEKSNIYSFSELDPKVKWKTYYQPQNSHKFKNLVPFSTYAKAVRGIATGANNYFTFNLSKAIKYNIDERYLLPCVCHSMDVQGNFFSKSDFEDLKQKDKDIFLINAVNSDSENVAKYLIKGEQGGINKKYLTASRNPWYAIEKRSPAPIWVSVFNRSGLRFIRNEANVANLTTFHCVYPQKNFFSGVSIDLLFAYLLTNTARLIFEDNSREYGNGLQKFEPNDLNKGKMLDIEKLSQTAIREILDLYRKRITCKNNMFVDQIDAVFVENFVV